MQNLKYLEEIHHNEDKFEIVLKPITEKYDSNIQLIRLYFSIIEVLKKLIGTGRHVVELEF